MTFKIIDPNRFEEMTAWVEKYPEKAAREIMMHRGMIKPAPKPSDPPPPPKSHGPRDRHGKR